MRGAPDSAYDALSLHHRDHSLHILVQVDAENVAEEVELAGLLRLQFEFDCLAGNDIGAHGLSRARKTP